MDAEPRGDLTNHAAALADEALAFSRRAVELLEKLAVAEPAAHLPGLATALDNHAHRLEEARRYVEAVEFSGSSVELREQLSRANPEGHLSDLAHATRNHANLLRRTARWEPAVAYSGRAVELFGTLAESFPVAFCPGWRRHWPSRADASRGGA